jgi:FkbM family methyltransferase
MMEYFFPNQSPTTLEMELRFRTEAEKLPQPSRLTIYEILSSCMASLTPTTFRTEHDTVIVSQNGREIVFPSPVPMVKLSHIVFGYEEWLERKYSLPGFVEVEAGDIVIDCGAYIGGFSMNAAKVAAQVHAFEPESANFSCLVRNFDGTRNVILNKIGLYSETGRMPLNISASSVEHSLLIPDDGQVVEVREIDVVTLEDYLLGKELPNPDFVKIEAEGVEPEVFDGLGGLRPRKLAIDVSPERNGLSPAAEFHVRLSAAGYEIRQRAHVMFARR